MSLVYFGLAFLAQASRIILEGRVLEDHETVETSGMLTGSGVVSLVTQMLPRLKPFPPRHHRLPLQLFEL